LNFGNTLINLNCKIYNVEITTSDGIILKAEINYNLKDYTIYMTEPSEIAIANGHLVHFASVVYATDEKPRENIHYIDLIALAKKSLIDHYTKEVKNES